MRITVSDCTAAGYCPEGIFEWFREQGLNYRAFAKNGIPVEEFLATNDGHAQIVVREKLKREGGAHG